MLNLLKRLFANLKAPESSDTDKLENQLYASKVEETTLVTQTDHQQDTVPDQWVAFNENLLERARTQWQFGDWESLASLNRETLQHHPDRAKLALLAASGKLQKNQITDAGQWIRQAQDWGVSHRLVAQILVSGVHNSIGRAAAINSQLERAQIHFNHSIEIGQPSADIKLLGHARAISQKYQITSEVLYGDALSDQNQAVKGYITNKQFDEATELKSALHYKGDVAGIYEWRPNEGGHNFGDHLAVLIAKMIFSDQSWKRIASGAEYIYAFIGSLLSDSNLQEMIARKPRPILIGCGYRGEKLNKKLINSCIVLGCRGPLTQSELSEAGIDVPWIGDPAMIIPILIPLDLISSPSQCFDIFVPHILDENRFSYSLETIGCQKIIQAKTENFEDLKSIIINIANAKFVLAGAMHAAIVACAYNVPFAFFDSKNIDCPIKWNDFAMSIGLTVEEVSFHTNLIDGKKWYEKIKDKIKKPNSKIILQQFCKVGDLKFSLTYAEFN